MTCPHGLLASFPPSLPPIHLQPPWSSCCSSTTATFLLQPLLKPSLSQKVSLTLQKNHSILPPESLSELQKKHNHSKVQQQLLTSHLQGSSPPEKRFFNQDSALDLQSHLAALPKFKVIRQKPRTLMGHTVERENSP